MDDYPQKGILQFFILMDDCYGLDFDNANEQNTFRVVYYDNIDENVKEEDILKIYNPYIEEEDYLPFEGEFKMVFTPYEEGITLEDFNFDKVFVKRYNELFQDNQIEAFWDLDDDSEDELYEEVSGDGSKIGGYPYFTQSDPREYDGLDVYDTLLFNYKECDYDLKPDYIIVKFEDFYQSGEERPDGNGIEEPQEIKETKDIKYKNDLKDKINKN